MSSSVPDLPPKVPVELGDLLRAVQLIGALGQAGSRLREKHRRELERLLGCVPDQQQAARWKEELKEIRRELAEESDDEALPPNRWCPQRWSSPGSPFTRRPR